jgi:Na+/melibiose symporter-like transporter
MSDSTGVRLATPVLLSYALPALVLALPTIPVYIHLPALYGIELGLGLAATGLVLLAARAFDTVTDPLVGALSDRFRLRHGRRKPWIAVGAVIAGLGLYKILNPPAAVDGAYLFGWSMVLYAGWTMVAVPYLAWGAELSADYNERTRITSWREGFMLAGIVGAGAVNAIVAHLGGTERAAVGTMAWVAILLGMMVRLLSAWFLNGLANGVPAALFFIYLEHGLGAGAGQRSLLVLAYFLAAILAISVWLPLSRRFGKHRVWCWAMAAACIAFAAVPLIPAGGLAAFGAVCVVTGAALGADLVLPPAIQADVVDYDRLRSGRSRAGLQFALWGMSTKLALAVAVGLGLPALEASGFDPVRPDDQGIRALVVIYALFPVVLKMTAMAVVWNFPLTADRHAVIRRRLFRLAAAGDNFKEATR